MRLQTQREMLTDMFAPHCPACGHRVLLGTGRIVTADLEVSTPTVLVRCFCGAILDAFQETPLGTAADPLEPQGEPPDPIRPRRAA